MAKKKRVKRAPKSQPQGVTINWAVVGLIVVIALLIGLWQMNGKPQSQAASNSGTQPKIVKDLNADTRLNGDVNLSWYQYIPPAEDKIVAWTVEVTPAGAAAPTRFSLDLSDVNSTTLSGQNAPIYYATVKAPAMVIATRGTVALYPVIQSAGQPSGGEWKHSGAIVNAILNY